MVDQVVDQADRVAEEVEDLAATNEEQAAMVGEVEDTVTKLADRGTATDGGTELVADEAEVSIPEDLPEGMPEFVVDMLPEEQLRAVDWGELDPSDVR